MSRYALEFGFSTSPSYRRAVDIAKRIPGYSEAGAGRMRTHSVPVSEQRLDEVGELVELVRGWRSARLCVDGVQAGPRALYRLVVMLTCFGERRLSGLDELYCQGLPAWPRRRVPCRLVDRVLPWRLEGDYRDPELLPRLVEALGRRAMVECCPAFELRVVQQAALELVASTDEQSRPGRGSNTGTGALSAADWRILLSGRISPLDALTECDLDAGGDGGRNGLLGNSRPPPC